MQIAEAVAAAHEHDVIHRDLKPGNIKITPEGKVKVLDFGLAKVVGGQALDRQTTITQPGRVIGTPAYMSPEQARGKPTDKRSDIWSFGCVLYEMLTGRLPFKGETVSDTLANILQTDPDWHALPQATPANILVLLRRCLEKDPRRRLRDIGDACIEIDETLHLPATAQAVTPAAPVRTFRRWPMLMALAVGALAVLLAVVVVGLILWWQARVSNRRPSIVTPVQLTSNPVEASVTGAAISPEGRYLAYADHTGLYLRLIENGETHLLALPEGYQAWDVDWYPDGTKLLVNGVSPESDLPGLWMVSILGGTPRKLHRGGILPSVSPDGSHVAFIQAATTTKRRWREVWIMGANGEEKRSLIISGENDSFWLLAWSPDSSRIVYGNWHRAHEGGRCSIETRHLEEQESTAMVTDPRLFQEWTGILPFVWGKDGRLIYARRESPPNSQSSNLWVVQADPKTGLVVGEPIRITQMAGFNFRKLSLTSDGKRLVSLLVRNQADVYVGELDAGGTRLKNERRLTLRRTP